MAADNVSFHLEATIPSLRHFERTRVFSSAEIKSITKRRTTHEYALSRRISKKLDYLHAIEYEMNLEKLRKRRLARIRQTLEQALKAAKTRKSPTDKKQAEVQALKAQLKDVNDHARDVIKRIHGLFQRAMKKFHGDRLLWTQWIDTAKAMASGRRLNKIVARYVWRRHTSRELWGIRHQYALHMAPYILSLMHSSALFVFPASPDPP